MIETNLEATYSNSVTKWADELVTRIKTGEYASEAAGWLNCSSITETASSKKRRSLSLEQDLAPALEGRAAITPLECPLVWAAESNAYDCVRFLFF